MLPVVCAYQDRYFAALNAHEQQEVPLPDEFKQIHYLLNPNIGQADPEQCKLIYSTLICGNSDVRGMFVVDRVYQQNLNTLWANALRLRERFNAVDAQYAETLQSLGQTANSALLRHQAALSHSHRAALEAKRQDAQRIKDNAVYQDLPAQIESAMLDGSFVLIRDIIHAIKSAKFYPGFNMHLGLPKIRTTLCSPQILRKMIESCQDDATQLPIIAKEVDALDAYAVEIMNQACLARAGDKWLYPNKGIVIAEARKILTSLLKDDPSKKDLIRCVGSTKLTPEDELDKIVTTALQEHLIQLQLGKAQAIISLKLVSDEKLERILATGFVKALQAGDLMFAKKIVATLNAGKNPATEMDLHHAFIGLVKLNNAEILRYVHELMGTACDQKLISEAITVARKGQHTEALAFLQAHTTSWCVIS